MKSEKAQHKTLPPNSTRIPLKTTKTEALSKQEKDEDRIQPIETNDDRISSNLEHCDDRILSKCKEAHDNDKDRMPSDEIKEEYHIIPKKVVNKDHMMNRTHN